MVIKKSADAPEEAVPNLDEDIDNPERNPVEALRRLTEIYESEESENEDENEADLINQLYDLANNGMRSDD